MQVRLSAVRESNLEFGGDPALAGAEDHDFPEARTGIRHDVVLTRPFIQDPGR